MQRFGELGATEDNPAAYYGEYIMTDTGITTQKPKDGRASRLPAARPKARG